MRVLLKNDEGFYLTEESTWTKDISKAKNFKSMSHANLANMSDCVVVYDFTEMFEGSEQFNFVVG